MDENEIIIPDTLRDEKARTLFNSLCWEYMRTHGVDVIPDGALTLLTDVCVMEQTKGLLQADIDKRGAMEHVRNGRQEYWKPNGSIAELNRLSSSQRRNLAELKLTPASRKGMMDNAPADDDFANY